MIDEPEIPAPSDLADGTEVIVTMTQVSKKIGVDEMDWDNSPEGIEAWCQKVSALQPQILLTKNKPNWRQIDRLEGSGNKSDLKSELINWRATGNEAIFV
jgi:hypothetical protein